VKTGEEFFFFLTEREERREDEVDFERGNGEEVIVFLFSRLRCFVRAVRSRSDDRERGAPCKTTACPGNS
jgi:hypothetical protein